MRVKDEAAGRKIRCPSCGAVLAVPRPQVEKDAEDRILDILLTESPAAEHPSPQPPKAAAEQVQEQVRRPTPPPEPARPSWARQAGGERPKAGPKIRKKKQREESGGGIAIHPSIVAGVGMMLGAATWFFVGLAANRIYYVGPPILFVLGIGAVIRGFKGEE
jgi:hypothetical protein